MKHQHLDVSTVLTGSYMLHEVPLVALTTMIQLRELRLHLSLNVLDGFSIHFFIHVSQIVSIQGLSRIGLTFLDLMSFVSQTDLLSD